MGPGVGPAVTCIGPSWGSVASLRLQLEHMMCLFSNQPHRQGTQVKMSVQTQHSAPASLEESDPACDRDAWAVLHLRRRTLRLDPRHGSFPTERTVDMCRVGRQISQGRNHYRVVMYTIWSVRVVVQLDVRAGIPGLVSTL